MATKKEPESKLIDAGYIYFLNENSAGLAGLREELLKTYESASEVKGADFSLDVTANAHYHLTGPARGGRLDVHIQQLANVSVVSLMRFSPEVKAESLGAQTKLLDGCEASLSATGNDVLGTALVAVDHGDGPFDMNHLKDISAPVRVVLSAGVGGLTVQHLMSAGARQHLLITGQAATSLHDLVAFKLPKLTWAIQKLHREWRFHEGQVNMILQGKRQTDAELSSILHRKVTTGQAVIQEAAKLLEEQINRLSAMYSVLATNMHVVKKATNAMEKDLVSLVHLAADFSPDGDESFPQYHVAYFRDNIKAMVKHESDLRFSLENTKAAIDIAQTQAEILRGSQGLVLQTQTRELLNQNIVLQDERMALQTAAQVVELVVVFYYTLKSWEAVATTGIVEELPSLIKFGVVATFSVSVVALTHAIGNSLHKRRFMTVPVLASGMLVILSLTAMALVPGL